MRKRRLLRPAEQFRPSPPGERRVLLGVCALQSAQLAGGYIL
jgi:hypothetical protein